MMHSIVKFILQTNNLVLSNNVKSLIMLFKSVQVYLAQTIFKLVMAMLVVGYTIPLLNSFSITHTCQPEARALVGFSTFECLHVLSSLIRKLLMAYLILLMLYGLLSSYTFIWILQRSVHSHARMQFCITIYVINVMF